MQRDKTAASICFENWVSRARLLTKFLNDLFLVTYTKKLSKIICDSIYPSKFISEKITTQIWLILKVFSNVIFLNIINIIRYNISWRPHDPPKTSHPKVWGPGLT